MKKFNTFISCLLFVFILSGCKWSLSNKVKQYSGDDCYIGIYPVDGNGVARTAIPNFVWGDFHYTLSAKVNGSATETLLVEKKAFSNFDNGAKLPVPRATYVFILTGYYEDDVDCAHPVIKGISDSIDLTGGYVPVTFRMYALKGLTGDAQITVTLPTDGVINSAKACVVDSMADDVANKLESVEIDTNSETHQIVYKPTGIASGSTKYARIFFYDADGKQIASIFESLIIVGGKTSYATRSVSADSYHLYDVSVTLKKDSATWMDASAPATITIVDSTGKEYTLTKTGDTYTGKVPDDDYTIKIGDIQTTGTFTPENGTQEMSFNTVVLPSEGGVVITPASGGISDGNNYIVPANGSFDAKVELKPGYEVDGNKVTINGEDVEVGSTITIQAGVGLYVDDNSKLIEYKIEYSFVNNGGSWIGGTQPEDVPVGYNVKNRDEILLPDYKYVEKDGCDIDGWITNVDGQSYSCSHIPEDIVGDLIFEPIWKTGVEIDIQPTEDGKIEGTIFACGYSLLIQWKNNDPTTNVTHVYYDFNGNGQIDTEDRQVLNANKTDNNFNNFILEADSKNGDETPASDFTFTMKGGRIASLVGLGSKKTNKSTVNISGTSILGDGATIGIDLPSLTNECVNINGQMSGEYSITLLSGKEFNVDKSYTIAYIDDSSYAQLGKFICINKDTKKELGIGIKDQGDKKLVYLTNPNSIAFPGANATEEDGGIIWINEKENGKTQFTLGDSTTISIPCSVFSLSVKNGKFQLQEAAALKDEGGADITTTNLARTSATEYSSTLTTGKNYYYMHMFSESNQITAASVTEFLKTIKFIKDSPDTEIELTVNLETMPYDLIKKMKEKYGPKKFDYYDGSFYLGVSKGDNSITWPNAYNEAKSIIFNGLNGYLITITSAVENNYIYKQMGLGKAWTGGSRLSNTKGIDSEVFYNSSYESGGNQFIWQCGPEAGSAYWGSKKYDGGDLGFYNNWDPSKTPLFGREPNSGVWSGEETCMHYLSDGLWNDYKYNNDDVKSYIVEFRPYTNAYGSQKANYPAISESAKY